MLVLAVRVEQQGMFALPHLLVVIWGVGHPPQGWKQNGISKAAARRLELRVETLRKLVILVSKEHVGSPGVQEIFEWITEVSSQDCKLLPARPVLRLSRVRSWRAWMSAPHS